MLYHVKNDENYPVKLTPLQLWEVNLHMQHWEENFDWSKYFSLGVNIKVYKLIVSGEDTIQGAIALEVKEDHVFVHLVESAPHNRGEDRVFKYVGLNLYAYACRISQKLGFEGFVAFVPKTNLVSYYQNALKAQMFGRNMIIDDVAAARLIELYL